MDPLSISTYTGRHSAGTKYSVNKADKVPPGCARTFSWENNNRSNWLLTVARRMRVITDYSSSEGKMQVAKRNSRELLRWRSDSWAAGRNRGRPPTRAGGLTTWIHYQSVEAKREGLKS